MAKNKRGSKVRDAFEYLSYLRSITPRRQKLLIKGADRPILEALSEICLNLIKKNVKLSPLQIKRLKPHEEKIYQLSLKRHSISKKKKIIQTGGFLTTILSIVLPAVLSAILGSTSK